ncbi:MAG: N-acetyltransferase [Actinobacteria bacterium 13_1_20CM_2_65_11]|nr:MAG: N-acetyltransferase [Chloroflexi bacterium 13_1_40CM_65_17]OLC66398.1 MAG: N-acetyltransferase [Actinobacteria bacterium 13_1_40CM_4_65_12]OLD24364.1 MAG: N-acetyltransferase [Chloroflexi bacterium 13_1_40CM_3_65_12]OLD49810.1 MAG: N-acetyltransferase [Actinobacteria bacterium 13_1_40CM_2_65_8]OLE80936.1 MAG: N-acetyltransferase [Actinobacteria bacterium 13_1_20CM_2_65_11]
MTIQLRAAEKGDVPVIAELIRGLARYEKLADQVEMTDELLAAGLFGERPYAEVVLAEEGGRPVGFALFFHNFSTFLGQPGIYLEDLFVLPEQRGRGIGRMLLEHLARLAVERGCGRLEWAVLDWNRDAIGFYESLGARPNSEWTVYRLTGEALTGLARQ